VLIRPTAAPVDAPARIRTREIGPDEAGLWARIAREGWSSESEELANFVEAFGPVVARATGVHCFLAELDGCPIAAATLSLVGDVALLSVASTIPSARRQGAQRALLAARLSLAAERGAMLAMMVAHPGSPSQRNAERQGFRTAYTRMKWSRRTGG
jgi:GNAT superfamily N-acetyltransferase